MSANDVDPRVMDQIAKLLALAGNNPEPKEAALALERAQALMKKYNVSTSDAQIGAVVEHPLRSWASASKTKDYEVALFKGIADAFGCGVMFKRGTGRDLKRVGPEVYFGHYIFVGPSVDVKVATYAATQLSKAMRKARDAYVKKTKHDARLHGCGASRRYLAEKADSYCLGWAWSVVEKVQPLVRPSVAARVQAYLEKETAGRVSKGKTLDVDLDAAIRGMRDGKEVQVHRPLDAGGAS